MYKKIVASTVIALVLIVSFFSYHFYKQEDTPKYTESTSKGISKHNKTYYPKKQHTLVDVLYGTDRGLKYQAPLETRYTTARDTLKFGIAQVSVPKTHTFGKVERPMKFLIFKENEKIGRDIVITQLDVLNQDQFANILQLKLNNASQADILIFIHGFNVTFAEAVRRTAQISYDLQFSGIPLTYSWPSKGKLSPFNYGSDAESVKYTTSHLVTFLTEVIKHKGNANIHILAHSMGTRALSSALKQLSMTHQHRLFKNIILAAPDISTDVFRKNFYPYVLKTTEKITLYANSEDTALRFSRKIHKSTRLGQGGVNKIAVFKDMVTIDATGIDTSMLGHSYFAEREMLVNDLRAIVHKSLPPQQRPHLMKALKNQRLYWKFDLPKKETHDWRVNDEEM